MYIFSIISTGRLPLYLMSMIYLPSKGSFLNCLTCSNDMLGCVRQNNLMRAVF